MAVSQVLNPPQPPGFIDLHNDYAPFLWETAGKVAGELSLRRLLPKGLPGPLANCAGSLGFPSVINGAIEFFESLRSGSARDIAVSAMDVGADACELAGFVHESGIYDLGSKVSLISGAGCVLFVGYQMNCFAKAWGKLNKERPDSDNPLQQRINVLKKEKAKWSLLKSGSAIIGASLSFLTIISQIAVASLVLLAFTLVSLTALIMEFSKKRDIVKLKKEMWEQNPNLAVSAR